MKKQFKSVRILGYLLFAAVWMLTLLGMVKTLLVSTDIDEAYAVAQAYRLVKGDRLLLDMWEPHQLSAYLPAILMDVFIKVTDSTDYIVLYLRMAGMTIHTLLGVWLYQVVKGKMKAFGAGLLLLLHMNFLAKWLQIPEFELMNYWYMLIVFLCMLRFYHGEGRKRYLVIAGIATMLQICNYPTMILLYPFYMLGIYKVNAARGKKKKVLGEMIWCTIASVLPGVVFVGYLFSYMDISDFQKALLQILSDPSHSEKNIWHRMLEYGLGAVQDIAVMAVVFGMVMLVLSFGLRRQKLSRKYIAVISLLIELMLFCAVQVYGCIAGDQNQFYLQSRYLLIAILGIFLYFRFEHKNKVVFWFGIIPGGVATLAALLVTNMTLNVAYSKLFICVIGSFMLLFEKLYEYEGVTADKEEADNGTRLKVKSFKHFAYIACMAIVMSLVVCKLVLIRVTSCLPVTVRADLAEVEQGPLKGIYILEREAAGMNEKVALLKEYVTEEDNLFYFGCENLLYLCTGAEISAASVQGTSVFNETFLEYLEDAPEKYPTVVAVDKHFATDYYRVYNPHNYIVLDWIEQEFQYTEKVETEDMILFFNKKL